MSEEVHRRQSSVSRRRRSSASHVNVDYFDHDGVRGLATFDSTETLSDPSNENWDFQEATKQIIRKAQEAGAKARSLGVTFQNLKVIGRGSETSHQATIGSLFNPSNIIESIQQSQHPHFRTILDGFNGVVQPGEMLLVLGNPGSGCSTLLKTLANQTQEYHNVEGNVAYDAFTPEQIQKFYRGEVIYCPEDDVHFPTLKVEDTIKFAVASRTPRERIKMTRDSYVKFVSDMLTTIFGLRHALKTVVGDAAIRGVSGGEKKRVSIAETLAAQPCLTSWDNSTRGLDSSTALEYVKAIRIATDNFKVTSIVSIYQAGENIYEHFDKVCIIYEGRMAYFGPADQAKQYFIDMGYVPANRQTTPDFLTAITDPLGRIERDGATPPRTAEEFAKYFNDSQLGLENREEIIQYQEQFIDKDKPTKDFMESTNADKGKYTRNKSPYMVSLSRQVKNVMARRVLIIRGNLLLAGINLFAFVFQALIMGSVYFNAPTTTAAFFSRGGVLFFALLFAALTAMSEIPGLYFQRAIITRHQKAAMYHPFIDALGMTLVDIPITFVTLLIFTVVLYFMIQLQQTASQFFIFFLFVFITSICMKAWFRMLAASFSSESAAQAVAGMSILVFAIYTGYQIPKPSMIKALSWLSYINPLRWSFEAVMVNEFRTIKGTCSTLVPQGPGYENVSLENQVCTTVGAVPGQSYVDGSRFLELSFGFLYDNIWMNFGIILAFTVGLISLLLLFTEINGSASANLAIIRYKRRSKLKAPRSGSEDSEKGIVVNIDLVSKEKSTPPEEAVQQPVTDIFSWQNLSYTVPVDDGERQLLNEVSGFVAPGKLTALMGESGAGKTTLLNVLASRSSTGVVSGDRFVNGHALPGDFQAQTGYCQQMDTHVPSATVREALVFSATLRQPPSVPLEEKIEYAEKCMKMCGLEAFGDAIVGTLGVEQRKRTTIAVELAAKPKLLLFLDEPTSGLDSQSAWAIVSFLRTLADKGQAILCTVHQPSAELFQVFDRLLLLQKGGKTAYFGDLGNNSVTLIQYFESKGARKCNPEENPAEWMLDVIGAGATAARTSDWSGIWTQSQEIATLQAQLKTIHEEGRQQPAIVQTLKSEFATSWLYQVRRLLKRSMASYWRDPAYILSKMFLNVFGGLFIGFTFWNSPSSQQGTQNKLFALFMATILSIPLSEQIQAPWIHMRDIYEIRERPSRMYSWTALVTSQILVELPWNIFGSSLLFCCWFWTVGFDTSRAGYTYLMLSVILPMYYQSFSQAVASMSPDPEISAVLFNLLFSFVITFNGVLQPYSQLGWWRWMYRLSPYTYVIEGILGQAIGNQDVICADKEFATIEPPSGETCLSYMEPWMSSVGGYLTNPNATASCQFCSIRTTDAYLAGAFNIFYSHHWRNAGIVLGFVVFNTVLIFLLTFLFRIKKGSLWSSISRLWK